VTVPPGPTTKIGVVVGNPKPQSRTRLVAEAVARAAAETARLPHPEHFVVDLADLGPRLFDWSDLAVKAAVAEVARCPLAIVASPTYKASYTGLLKAFLDWFTTTGMSKVTVVPVMVGAGAHHALAVEVHLRPVLVEIGASVPTRGLFVLESDLDDLDAVIGAWLEEAGPRLRAALGSGQVG
jgi:FMN reductase